MSHPHDPSLLQGLEVGRRCLVTLLFSDLCDYTRLGEVMDPEDVAALLDAVKETTKGVIQEHGGTLNQFYGDGMLAVFGLPASREDDVRRALDAALALHEAIRALRVDVQLPPSFALRLHSGVDSGLVFARTSDAPGGRYEIVGDCINTAARLCAAADPDQILASEITLRGVSDFFATQSVPPLQLKGKSEVCLAHRVLGRSAVSTRFEARLQRGLTPFVGRSAALEALASSLQETLSGRWQLVHVVGDAGVGKTRLLAEFRARLASVPANVYSGRAESYGHMPPLQPFSQILQQALGVVEEEARPSAVCQSLLDLSERRPLVLLLDDWQWADDASYLVLSRLLRALEKEAKPVMIVTAARSRDAADPISALGSVLELGPLERVDAERVIEALLPSAVELGVAERIRESAGNNPLFLEELCESYAVDQRQPVATERPSSLHSVIQARVARLPPELMAVAAAAAVIGSTIELWMLEHLLGNALGPASLEQLVKHALFVSPAVPGGAYRFKHGAAREVVYDSVRLLERRRLHRAIAAAIEARHGAALHEQCEALAYHYAGAAEPSRAAQYAEMAGDKAYRGSSLDRARQHYRAALRELELVPSSAAQRERWLDVSRKWAAACAYIPEPEQVAVLERALEHTERLGDPAGVAHSHYWLGWIHYALGDQARAIVHIERALELVQQDAQGPLVAQLIANRGQVHMVAAEPAAALRCLERATAMKLERARGRSSSSVPVGFLYALGCQGLVHGYLGAFADADRCLSSALGRIDGAQHAIEPSLLGMLVIVQLWQGAHPDARESARRMRVSAERVRGPYTFASSQALGCYARWMLEPTAKALGEITSAVDWLDQRQMRLLASLFFALAAEALAADAQWSRARQYARRALARVAHEDRLGEVAARRVIALCDLKEGAPLEQARAELDQAQEAARTSGSPREQALVELTRAWALERESGPERALQCARPAIDALAALGMHWHVEQLARLFRPGPERRQ